MRRQTQIFSFFLIFLLLLGGAASQPCPAAEMTAEEVFKKAQDINPNLKDYSAKLKIRINDVRFVVNFPPMRLRADFYYQAPGKVSIHVKQAPSFLNKYMQQAFKSHFPKIEDFNAKLGNSAKINGDDCWLVILIPKQPMGDLLSHQLYVSKKDFTIPRQRFTYNNEGEIDVQTSYVKKDGFWLFKEMEADFSYPRIKLTAKMLASYDDFCVNKGLDSRLFTD